MYKVYTRSTLIFNSEYETIYMCQEHSLKSYHLRYLHRSLDIFWKVCMSNKEVLYRESIPNCMLFSPCPLMLRRGQSAQKTFAVTIGFRPMTCLCRILKIRWSQQISYTDINSCSRKTLIGHNLLSRRFALVQPCPSSLRWWTFHPVSGTSFISTLAKSTRKETRSKHGWRLWNNYLAWNLRPSTAEWRIVGHKKQQRGRDNIHSRSCPDQRSWFNPSRVTAVTTSMIITLYT